MSTADVGERNMLNEWQQWMRATGAADSTTRCRIAAIRSLMASADLKDPALVTTMQIVAWLAALKTPWTRCTYWNAANAWCRYLIDSGVRADNPCTRIPRPRQPHGLPRPVPAAIIRQLLTQPLSVRGYQYVVLAVFAGLRVHEIAKIRSDDVDLAAMSLFVDGKGGHQAILPLHPAIAQLAKQRVNVGYWFPGVDNGHVLPITVSQTVKRALVAAGSTQSAHALRHAYGTAVLRSSRDMRVAQTLLRHRSLASTQLYTAVSNVDQVQAIARLDWAA